MYQFDRSFVGGFTLHTSRPSRGDEHHKRFGHGVTPANQATLNLYTAGRFELLIAGAGYRREMLAGQCSLDIELPAYPQGLCVERCLEDGGCRICVSPTAAGVRWSRHVIQLEAGGVTVLPMGHSMIALAGELELDGYSLPPGFGFHVDTGGQVLRSSEGGRAVLMAII